ncbi:MAG: ROK family glucokinase [Lachnospiraceae bacterium]|nr:ROK family glucokinase [Lachnospiraceae bacterium]
MKKYAFGVDIGGTTVKMGLFEKDGTLVSKWDIVTTKDNNGEKILPDIAASLKKKMEEEGLTSEDIEGVGVGVPGAIDSEGKLVGNAANLGWVEKDIRKELSDLMGGLKTVVANDANVAGYGEMWAGGAKGYTSVCMVTLGTGVGGGIIIDGNILAGATGAGGEIGHICVNPDETESCGCGLKGCLEMYASATGIVRLAKRRLAKDDAPSVLRKDDISAKTVFDGVKNNDAVCKEVATEFGRILGKGLGSLASVINPEIFVIGGGVSKAGSVLLDYVVDEFKKNTINACRNTKFALATLGNDAGIIGAAGLILNK